VPDQPREALEQREIEVPGALQGCLRPLPIRDIPERCDHAGDLPFAVREHTGVDLDGYAGSGFEIDVELPLDRFSAAQDVLEEGLNLRRAFRAKEDAHGLAHAFPGAEACDLIGPGIGVGRLALQVEGDDAIADGHGDEMVLLLRLLDLAERGILPLGQRPDDESHEDVHDASHDLVGQRHVLVSDIDQEKRQEYLDKTEEQPYVHGPPEAPEPGEDDGDIKDLGVNTVRAENEADEDSHDRRENLTRMLPMYIRIWPVVSLVYKSMTIPPLSGLNPVVSRPAV
jgi:hypothetical protein